MLPIRDMLDNLIWNEFYEFSDVFRRIFIKFSYPFAVISWTIGMLSLHIWGLYTARNGISLEGDWDFCWQSTRNYLYKDLSRWNCIWYLFMFFVVVSARFWAFHPLLIIFQALMLVHTFSPNKSVFVLTKPVRQRQSKCSFYKCQIHFSAFFMYFSIKSTCWNFLFKSILVLREFNACCKVEFALSNFRMTYLCVLAFSFFHSVSFVPFHWFFSLPING